MDSRVLASLTRGTKHFKRGGEEGKKRKGVRASVGHVGARVSACSAGQDFFSSQQQQSSSRKRLRDEEQAEQEQEEDEEPVKKRSKEAEDMGRLSDAEVARMRRVASIKVDGTDLTPPVHSFSELAQLGFKDYLLRNVEEEARFTQPAPIQMQAMPLIKLGRELLACAPTGSGKTLAFLLPILAHLKAPARVGFRALIVQPTRELAEQTHRECLRFAKGRKWKVCLLTHTSKANKSIGSKEQDILIATPLKLVHYLHEGILSLARVERLVLDEADRLFDLGFVQQIDEIIAACTFPGIQRSLFSATLPDGVEVMARSFLVDPVRVVIGFKNKVTETIVQRLKYVGREEGKLLAMRQMMAEGVKPPVIIFVQSIDRAKQLFKELVYEGVNVDVIHSERTKEERDHTVNLFRRGKVWFLIATELMARGMDFKGVNLVVNFDFPQTPTSYIHRIGRTGRAGRSGEAVTFFTDQDADSLRSIATVMRQSGCEVEDWMLKLKKPSEKTMRARKVHPRKREDISTTTKVFRDKNLVEQKKQQDHQSKPARPGSQGHNRPGRQRRK